MKKQFYIIFMSITCLNSFAGGYDLDKLDYLEKKYIHASKMHSIIPQYIKNPEYLQHKTQEKVINKGFVNAGSAFGRPGTTFRASVSTRGAFGQSAGFGNGPKEDIENPDREDAKIILDNVRNEYLNALKDYFKFNEESES